MPEGSRAYAGPNWQETCFVKDEFSSALKESGLAADPTYVPEHNVLEITLRGRWSVDEATTLECKWINEEFEKRVSAAERRFGIDMVPETDE